MLYEVITYIKKSMQEYKENFGDDVEVIYTEAKGDQEKQDAQVEKFIEAGMDAIIVLPVDVNFTSNMTRMAMGAKIPIRNNFV